jgi:hypothetical protein
MSPKQNRRMKIVANASGASADWTIMLYIAADGNLANFAVESLKQLNHTAGKDIVVAAQFAIDAPAGQQIPRYIFTNAGGGGIGNSLDSYLNAPNSMTEQEALISFLKWVYEHPKCAAKNYALILWGHGPELLLQPPSGQEINNHGAPPQNQGLYLTPLELEDALRVGIGKHLKPKIIAFDACSMAMFEVAYQIADYAQFIVASQEEVPDPSFPYDTLLGRFRSGGGNPAKLCAEAVDAYVQAYEDYICNSTTGMKRVTLSALRLANCKPLVDALKTLADAFWTARNQSSLPLLLMEARECTRDFAGGLYADIYDFCENLSTILWASTSIQAKLADAIQKACRDVMTAVDENYANGLVIANSSADNRCHGLSIYFPYLNDEQYTQMRQPMVKGGTDTIGKGFCAVMNSAAPNLLMCVRRQLILETEGYYTDLRLANDTGWHRFIGKQWSEILVKLVPYELDVRYSAQQSSMNAFKTF